MCVCLCVSVHVGVRSKRTSKWSERTTGIQKEGDKAGCGVLRGGVGEDEENSQMRDVTNVVISTVQTRYYTATIW